MRLYCEGRPGYCSVAKCKELSDEPGPFPLCAYHRDHPEAW